MITAYCTVADTEYRPHRLNRLSPFVAFPPPLSLSLPLFLALPQPFALTFIHPPLKLSYNLLLSALSLSPSTALHPLFPYYYYRRHELR